MFTIYNDEEDRYEQVEEPDASYSYSYADYVQWKFKERLELIKGHIFKLSAPNTRHQVIAGDLFVRMHNFLGKNPCKVFIAPFDVRLPRKNQTGDKDIKTVVQPDICVVCDDTKIDERGCCGAPDLVIEILSPGNSSHEVRTKFRLYEEAGVKEYWLINPAEENLVIYLLGTERKYEGGKMYAAGDVISSEPVTGFNLEVAAIFEQQ